MEGKVNSKLGGHLASFVTNTQIIKTLCKCSDLLRGWVGAVPVGYHFPPPFINRTPILQSFQALLLPRPLVSSLLIFGNKNK